MLFFNELNTDIVPVLYIQVQYSTVVYCTFIIFILYRCNAVSTSRMWFIFQDLHCTGTMLYCTKYLQYTVCIQYCTCTVLQYLYSTVMYGTVPTIYSTCIFNSTCAVLYCTVHTSLWTIVISYRYTGCTVQCTGTVVYWYSTVVLHGKSIDYR